MQGSDDSSSALTPTLGSGPPSSSQLERKERIRTPGSSESLTSGTHSSNHVAEARERLAATQGHPNVGARSEPETGLELLPLWVSRTPHP